MHLPFLLRTYRPKFSKTRIQSIGYKEKVLHLHKLSTFVPYTMRYHKTTIRTPHGEKLLFKLPKKMMLTTHFWKSHTMKTCPQR